MRDLLQKLVHGQDLTREEARDVVLSMMSESADPALVAALLAALAQKGETADEIVGAALALRDRLTPVQCPGEAIDTCGTGGDGISTFNVSTTAAIIAAGAGATVAKHGNRSNSRRSGSAEVLQILGVGMECTAAQVETCLQRARIAFLYAPLFHPAMRFVAPVRRSLGVRTIFNLLGPLASPAGVRRQVIGVPRPELTETLAIVARELGGEHVWVVHGSDGLCDLTSTGPTRITELATGEIRTFEVAPESCGINRTQLAELLVDSPQSSAEAVRAVLSGRAGPHRDHSVLNAGAALVVAGQAGSLAEGVAAAGRAVDSGAAAATLEAWIRHSQGNVDGAAETQTR